MRKPFKISKYKTMKHSSLRGFKNYHHYKMNLHRLLQGTLINKQNYVNKVIGFGPKNSLNILVERI